MPQAGPVGAEPDLAVITDEDRLESQRGSGAGQGHGLKDPIRVAGAQADESTSLGCGPDRAVVGLPRRLHARERSGDRNHPHTARPLAEANQAAVGGGPDGATAVFKQRPDGHVHGRRTDLERRPPAAAVFADPLLATAPQAAGPIDQRAERLGRTVGDGLPGSVGPAMDRRHRDHRRHVVGHRELDDPFAPILIGHGMGLEFPANHCVRHASDHGPVRRRGIVARRGDRPRAERDNAGVASQVDDALRVARQRRCSPLAGIVGGRPPEQPRPAIRTVATNSLRREHVDAAVGGRVHPQDAFARIGVEIRPRGAGIDEPHAVEPQQVPEGRHPQVAVGPFVDTLHHPLR